MSQGVRYFAVSSLDIEELRRTVSGIRFALEHDGLPIAEAKLYSVEAWLDKFVNAPPDEEANA